MTSVTSTTSGMDLPPAACRAVCSLSIGSTPAVYRSIALPLKWFGSGKSIRTVFAFLLVSMVALCVTACGSVKVTLQSDVPQRDAGGKPLPVVLRFYQLSSKDRFQKADFLSLFRSDQKLLEKDLLWRKEMTLFPNSDLVIKENRKKGAKYLGVMALFREKGTAWRQVVDLDEKWILSVKVKVQEQTITAD